tara:strand:+ start:602 stop:1288 length:687 start_codon:yes stop_codon:yes gene_type:complete
MQISIFKDLATDDYIAELQAESEKYTGLYVDMNNAPERKYVKGKADDINQLLKKIDRKRIDVAKKYKQEVEAEAADITDRLKEANLPFTLLIDEHKAERAKILADEKRVVELREFLAQKELDHEMALLINKTYEFDKTEELRIIADRDDAIRKQVIAESLSEQSRLAEAKERDKVNAENARLANKEHCAKVNRNILACLLDEGFNENEARKFIKLAAQNKLPQLTINY